jgi:uncharacterized protein (DUF433 family)
MSCQELLADYDELRRDDILAVLEFAAREFGVLDSTVRLQRFVA